jgi:hypothetical protein
MKIPVTWRDSEKTTLYVKFERGWSWDDFWTMNQTFNQLARTVNHHVVLWVDMTDAGLPSSYVPQMRKIADLSKERPQNLAYTIVIGVSGLVKIAVDIFNGVYRSTAQHVIFVANMDEAQKVMTQRPLSNR